MDVGSLANSLVGIHAMMAMGLKAPEMAISEEEAKRLAGPIVELQKHYKVPFDPKWVAWFQLTTAAGAVYLPRVLKATKRVQNEKVVNQRRTSPTEGLNLDTPPAEDVVPVQDPSFKMQFGG